MYNFRYYAIGHSYLLHGPFPGWQTDGFWGMAATEPDKDYFHRFQQLLGESFDCKIEAVAENHADYERLCTIGATRETYENSSQYAHMKEVLFNFKPNIISVFVGGGNTVAEDDESITLFFDVLYEMIAKYKRPDAVVVCPNLRKNMWACNEKMAKKHGLIPIDTSVIHEKKGYENPYYAYNDYPEYDEKAAAGAVEFRTHPNNAGHDLIAHKMLAAVQTAITEQIPQGTFDDDYRFKEYIIPEKLKKLTVFTEPELFLSFYGFNLREENGCIIFGSAPDTGASISAERIFITPKYNKFYIEMAVSGTAERIPLNVTFTLKEGTLELSSEIKDSLMHRYEFDLSDNTQCIKSFRVSPDTKDCVITLKAVGFAE